MMILYHGSAQCEGGAEHRVHQNNKGAGNVIPIYLVSPHWLVTREHIISDKASTSSSFTPGVVDSRSSFLVFSISLSRLGSGDAGLVCGDGLISGPVAVCAGEGGDDTSAIEACRDFSVSFFSRAPRSPSSSSRRPNECDEC